MNNMVMIMIQNHIVIHKHGHFQIKGIHLIITVIINAHSVENKKVN